MWVQKGWEKGEGKEEVAVDGERLRNGVNTNSSGVQKVARWDWGWGWGKKGAVHSSFSST